MPDHKKIAAANAALSALITKQHDVARHIAIGLAMSTSPADKYAMDRAWELSREYKALAGAIDVKSAEIDRLMSE